MVDNLIIALLIITLFVVYFLFLTMISKLQHIKNLIELYGEKGWNISQKRIPEDISKKERKSKMVDCSKTEEFLKEWKRMCDSSHCTCQMCYLYKMEDIGSCHTAMRTMPKQVILEVQKWSDEHPRKTRQSKFLKLFPNARMRDDCSVLNICPRELDKHFICKKSIFCVDCQKHYWLAEVE